MSYYHTHIITQDETMQSIAFKYLGDTSYWRELVSMNNLEYPYIVNKNVDKLVNPEHLKTLGDTIKLPIKNSIASLTESNLNAYSKDSIYDMTLGIDVALKVNADSTFEEATGEIESDNNGDIETVSGINNLKQSLMMRIMTRRGTLLNHPSYGSNLPSYIGLTVDNSSLQRAIVELERTITTDTRVAKVDVPTADILEDGSIFIYARITPISFSEAFELFILRANTGEVSLR